MMNLHAVLKESMDNYDAEGIQEALDYIRAHQLYGMLQQDSQEGERMLRQLKHDQDQDSRGTTMQLNRATVSELGSYQNPPREVHEVMIGSLLLLGESEDNTSVSTIIMILRHRLIKREYCVTSFI